MNNQFKKFNKIPLIISVCFLALSIVVYIVLYKNINLNNQLSEKAASDAKIEATKRQEIKTLDRSLKSTADERAMLDTHFVQSSDVVPLLDSIEKIGPMVKAKAAVTQVDISQDKQNLTVGVTVEGTFDSQYRFLTLLENSVYPLEIVSMDMQKTNDGTIPDIQPAATLSPDTTPEGQTMTLPPPTTTTLPRWSATYKIKLKSFLR